MQWYLSWRLPGTYPFSFLTYLRQQAMVFSSKDKAIIENDMKKKAGWYIGYVMRLSSLLHLLKWFKEDGSMKRRRHGSSWLITVTANENAELVEELICSQEDFSRNC